MTGPEHYAEAERLLETPPPISGGSPSMITRNSQVGFGACPIRMPGDREIWAMG
jgi:hypothetical protein